MPQKQPGLLHRDFSQLDDLPSELLDIARSGIDAVRSRLRANELGVIAPEIVLNDGKLMITVTTNPSREIEITVSDPFATHERYDSDGKKITKN